MVKPDGILHHFGLDGKTALIVGGRGLLGRRIAVAMAEMGADVFAADLAQVSPAASSDNTFRGFPDGVRHLDIDVCDQGSVAGCVDAVVAENGVIDILVFSVTRKTKDSYVPYTEASLEGWREVMKAESEGLFLTTQQVGKQMEKQGSGSMVLFSSIYGVVGNDQRIYEGANLSELYSPEGAAKATRIYGPGVYPAVKGGVIALTRFLAAYWGSKGIRVNCLSPGGAAHPGENEEFVRRYSERTPLGRKAEMEEIVAPVLFLASDAASYITGHNLMVDGGWTAW